MLLLCALALSPDLNNLHRFGDVFYKSTSDQGNGFST